MAYARLNMPEKPYSAKNTTVATAQSAITVDFAVFSSAFFMPSIISYCVVYDERKQ